MLVGAVTVSAASDLAADLASAFGLRAGLLGRVAGFDDAARSALDVGTAAAIVSMVHEGGPLTGARNPYATVAARLRQVASDLAAEAKRDVQRGAAEAVETLVRARRRGAQLAVLVDRGEIPADAARWLLEQEFAPETAAEAARFIAAIVEEAAS